MEASTAKGARSAVALGQPSGLVDVSSFHGTASCSKHSTTNRVQFVSAVQIRSSERRSMASSSSGQKERGERRQDTAKEQADAAPDGNPQPKRMTGAYGVGLRGSPQW